MYEIVRASVCVREGEREREKKWYEIIRIDKIDTAMLFLCAMCVVPEK